MLTSNEDIGIKWKEYYSQLFNETFPSEEVKPAIKMMVNNKATGLDKIPAKVWRKLEDAGVIFLTNLPNKILTEGIPDESAGSQLVAFYKN